MFGNLTLVAGNHFDFRGFPLLVSRRAAKVRFCVMVIRLLQWASSAENRLCMDSVVEAQMFALSASVKIVTLKANARFQE